jgi:hypothetical protein
MVGEPEDATSVTKHKPKPLQELRERVDALEAELQEQRRLSRRLAELIDVVTELLIPIAQRDERAVEDLLLRYRDRL